VKGPYLPTNLEYWLVVYEWKEKLSIFDMLPLFERIAALIGYPPDDVWMCRAGEWKGKSYKYRNFLKRDAIHQDDWANLSYDWRRQPDARLYLAASVSVSLDLNKCISVHIDEAATTDVELVYEAVISSLCERLQPLYGMGFAVPYSWQAHSFVVGQGSGYLGPETGLLYDSAEAFCIRGINAGRILLDKPRVLDKKIRDVFELNLLSEGHFASTIEGENLESWIVHGNHGSLKKITPVTWRWDIPKEKLPAIRKSAIAANLIADPFWTKLGWIDK
jgi:hypothetical protein